MGLRDMMAKRKEYSSIKVNMVLNAVKGLLSVVFPLISFPYVSRILGVDNIGKYNFSNSVISYFILLASLGIHTYAVREGARIRGDSIRLKHFADEMFTINVASTAASYCLLGVLVLMVGKFQEYKWLLFILSFQIAFKTIGIEWIYSIYEDYLYITIRSIIFQLLSLILLLTLVKTETDINAYAAITVISGAGANILNYIHAKKYCKVKLAKPVEWKKHIKPIFIFFGMTVAVTLYVNSDITILGFLCGDRVVGIYSVSTKIYTIVKTVLSSVIVVSIPRLSALYGEGRPNDFILVAEDIYKLLLSIAIPSIVGVILLRKEIVNIVSGKEYISSESSLFVLSIALFFCLASWFWGQCILVIFQMEQDVFKATCVSALVNIGLNFIFIPWGKENAAAFTTLLAELLSYIWCKHKSSKIIKIKGIGQTICKIMWGCIGIVTFKNVIFRLIKEPMTEFLLTITMSVIIYFLIEVVIKNEEILNIAREIKGKISLFKKR